MNWNEIINELCEHGLSEAEIASRLELAGVKVSQASINRLKRGLIKNPRYEFGDALKALHESMRTAA